MILSVILSSVIASAATPKPAAGGAMQRQSTEGCIGDKLFDGVWRVQVLSIDPAASYNDGTQNTGIGVKVQVKNGTSKEMAPDESGFSDINGRGIDLVYDNDNSVNLANAGGFTANLMDKKLAPGAGSTITLYFPYDADKNAKPSKLLIAVDEHATNNYKKVHYSTKSPSFRIHLDCPAKQ